MSHPKTTLTPVVLSGQGPTRLFVDLSSSTAAYQDLSYRYPPARLEQVSFLIESDLYYNPPLDRNMFVFYLIFFLVLRFCFANLYNTINIVGKNI